LNNPCSTKLWYKNDILESKADVHAYIQSHIYKVLAKLPEFGSSMPVDSPHRISPQLLYGVPQDIENTQDIEIPRTLKYPGH